MNTINASEIKGYSELENPSPVFFAVIFSCIVIVVFIIYVAFDLGKESVLNSKDWHCVESPSVETMTEAKQRISDEWKRFENGVPVDLEAK